jgi:hypothetical protein
LVGDDTRQWLEQRLISIESSIDKTRRDREYRHKKMKIMAKECRNYNTNLARLKGIRADLLTVLGKENWNV